MPTPLFHRLIVDRPSTDEEELRSYFRSLAEATGPPPSNFETVLRRLWSGGVDRVDENPEHRACLVESHRRVAAALEAAGAEAAEVLHLCLGTDSPPELEVYGLLAGLILCLPDAVGAFEQSGTDLELPSWLGRLPRLGRQERAVKWLVDDLISQAKHQFIGALLSYREARRRLGLGRR